MDKFLLAENPMRPGKSGLFIIHMLNPKAIIRCTEGHMEIDTIFRHYQYRNSDGVLEEWTLSAYFFYTTDFLTDPQEQVAPLLDKAWRWYRAYLEGEDKNIDDENKAIEN